MTNHNDDLAREIAEAADAIAPGQLSFLAPGEATADEAAEHVKQQLLDAGYDHVPDEDARELVRQAWEQLAAQRNARAAEGYHYAGTKPDVPVATQRGFGDLWADVYSAAGLTIAAAWERYKSG